MAPENTELAALQAQLTSLGARWSAGLTSLSQLPQSEQQKHLGAVPPPGQASLQEREHMARANLSAAAGVRAAGIPASFDWRNNGGINYITPIKDQGGCGSCVAFGTCATVEGMYQISRSNPTPQLDESEAHLFYCLASAQGCSCGNGCWPDTTFDCFKNTGVADEACFPYTAGDQACSACADWQSRVKLITGWHHITSAADMKTWLSQSGPLSTCFTVYDDFFRYTSGVYSHVSTTVAGGHCVSVVGYDDANGCWICKNSWGTGWGESGFFRIAYGDSGIDATMWAAEGIVQTGWENGRLILGLWSIDQDVNAWAFVDGGLGWRKVATDNANIFYDILAQLIAAKASSRPVNLYQEQGVIKQLYVL